MKTKILMLLECFLLTLALTGCGGYNSETPVATSSSIGSKIAKEIPVAPDWLQEQFSLITRKSTRTADIEGTILFSDTFSDSGFDDDWMSFIDPTTGNYTITQQNGMLNILGDATGNHPSTGQGRTGVISEISASASSPIVVAVDINATGSIAVTGSFVGSTLFLADEQGQMIVLNIFVDIDPNCVGSCLKFIHVSPVTGQIMSGTLKTNILPAGRLGIAYQNGTYTPFFGDETFPNVTMGFNLVGEVRAVLSAGTQYAVGVGINPADVILNTKFDNFLLDEGVFTTCDPSASKTILENVKQEVHSLGQEMEQGGIGKGFAAQLFSAIKTGLDNSIALLDQERYTNAISSLKGVVGRFSEVEKTLKSMRGKNISPVSIDEWTNKIAILKGKVKSVIEEIKLCR